jgi:hypothetical protein
MFPLPGGRQNLVENVWNTKLYETARKTRKTPCKGASSRRGTAGLAIAVALDRPAVSLLFGGYLLFVVSHSWMVWLAQLVMLMVGCRPIVLRKK